MATYHLIGNYISPYVRKVLVCMELKGLDYTIDPIAPFVGNERFTQLSPLRRIPVLVDGDRVFNDSSVICQYLDERHPQPSLYPSDIGDRAQARWIEEYCDTWLGDVVVWGMFFQKGVKRYVFGEEPDETIIARARDEQLPLALGYLESLLPADGFLFGELSVADISIASFFRNAAFVRYVVDTQRWPRVAALLEQAWDLPTFRKLAELEEKSMRTPLAGQRQVLMELGAPVSTETLGTATPRRGVMRLE